MMLERLPPSARSAFPESMEALARALPGSVVMATLAEAANVELPPYLEVNAAERLAEASVEQREAVRSFVLNWAKQHPYEISLVVEPRVP